MTKNKRVTLSSLILLILVVFLAFQTTAKNPSIESTSATKPDGGAAASQIVKESVPQYPFKIGERLNYGIYSVGVKVGSAVITYLGEKQVAGQLVSLITIKATAPGFYDVERIYGDIANSTPLRIEREIKLFGKNINIIEEYDKKNNEVLITHVSNNKTEKIKGKSIFNNIILLLYQFRYNNNYEIGEKLQFNLPTKKLEISIDSQKSIKVPFGKFDAIFVKSIPSQFKAWFQKGKDGIPLRVQGAIGFGNTYLSLISVD